MNARMPAASDPSPRPGRLVLLGHPVAHSLSPTFQNAALDAAGVHLRYEAFDVAPHELRGVLEELRRVSGAGNVTVPHKRAVAEACDVLTETARAVGAVNTFWCARDGTLVGDNTDVAGAAAALRAVTGAGRASTQPRVALLGAGGAAAAVVEAVVRVWPDAHIAVWSRRPADAAAFAARSSGNTAHAFTTDEALGAADLVVNATPLGLGSGDAFPCAVERLPRHAAVLDLVYGSRETAWVRAARAAGHDARDGLLMLVEQGAAAFERWFGRAPDRDRMWRAVEERTGRTFAAEAVP